MDERILDELRRKPWQKASELARALGADRSEVNALLYGRLKKRVVQDRAYRWALLSAETGSGDKPEAVVDTLLARLCRYYLDCLQRGEQGGVSVFGSSFRETEYAELRALKPTSDGVGNPFADPEPARIMRPCLGRRATHVLRVGYPVFVASLVSRNGKPFTKVEPLFIWTPSASDVERQGIEILDREIPSLNPAAVQHLTGLAGMEALDALLHMSRELGLDQPTSEPPDIEEMVRRVHSLRPEWPWREAPDPANLVMTPELSAVSDSGIVNRAVVVATERSPYTKGLEEELGKLAREAGAQDAPSALRDWVLRQVALPLEPAPSRVADATSPLVEVIPLNTEQREAVEKALTRRLTVVTGPPGTGKSQVVSAILVNAAWRGMRVLFASKNHKAVDVVEDRVNRLGPRPFVLRLGSGELAAALRQHLTSLLSASPTAEDQRAFDEAARLIGDVRRELTKLDEEASTVVTRRNQVDSLEQKAEAARATLGDERFKSVSELDTAPSRAALQRVEGALASLEPKNAGFFARLFWGMVFPKRLERALPQLTGAARLASELGVSLPSGELRDRNLGPWWDAVDAWQARIDLAEEARAYLAALSDLSGRRPLEAIVADRIEWMRQVAGESQRLWDAWLRIAPTRMADDSRQELSDFAAVLELISGGNEESGRIAPEVWSRYYRLAQKVVSILPCWSITSLSAKGRLPFEPASFDLVVLDEASQCDIASALPLLYRAKAAVIIGDPQQLRHITPLNPSDDSRLLAAYRLVESNLSWAFSSRSLFDLAQSLCPADGMVQLRDHHRSHHDIIGFSNECFYEGRLRVATKLDSLKRPTPQTAAVRWIDVTGQVERPSGTSLMNEKEARAVVAELDRLVVGQAYRGSVGVVSPFRAQVNRIRDLVNQHPRLNALQDRIDFLADSVHSFQGDERDVMIFSPTISQGRIDRAVGFLGNSPNLFNVAVTRARAALIVIGDRAAARNCGVDYFRRFIEYVAQVEHPRPSTPIVDDLGAEYPRSVDRGQVSEWERILYRALYRGGIRTIPQYAEEKFLLDLALLDGARKLDIEVDGERYHRAWDGELLRRDQLRNMRLIELGWDVMRFWVYQVRDEIDACVERVAAWKRRSD